MIEILQDTVELYPARVLLEVDTFESRDHSIMHLLLCCKNLEWIPLPLKEIELFKNPRHNLN